MQIADGIVIVAENPSTTLRKVSEIYDRIAFAGVGKYNEFDQLRVAGVRAAELRGYQYSRNDVDARSLANQYAQVLGDVFSTMGPKPLEVELLVVEVSDVVANDRMFHILYDGTLLEEKRFCVLGGDAEAFLSDSSPTSTTTSMLRVRSALQSPPSPGQSAPWRPAIWK